MRERTAFIAYFILVMVVEALLMGILAIAGAGSETWATAIVLLISGAGLGVGFIGVHYH